MKTTHELKAFFKQYFGAKARANTSTGKSHYQGVYIPAEGGLHKLIYTQPPFSEEFRKLCIKTVYPDSPTLQEQVNAGNIGAYSIAMLPDEWESVIKEWMTSHQPV